MELEKISLNEWLSNPNTRPADYDNPDFKKRYDAYCEKNGLKDKKLDINEFEEIADKVNEDWDNEEVKEDVENQLKDMATDKRSLGQYIADDIEQDHIEKVYSEDDDLDEYLKDLDKYMSKNKKGREDIPATYKR